MNELENSSGTGKTTEVPAEIRGWNWGAFFLNFFWGIGNKSSGDAVVYAEKTLGEWHLKEVVVYNRDEEWTVPVVTQKQFPVP
jgi:hypothetical protein